MSAAVPRRPAPPADPAIEPGPPGEVGAAATPRPGARPAVVRYGVAVLLAALAFAITWALQPLVAPVAAPAFYAAVAVSAWFGGLGPSLLTTLLSTVVLNLVFFDLPEGPPLIHPDALPRLLLFLITALLVSALSASQRRTALALWASEQRYRTMVETGHEGIWMVDANGRTRYANDRMARLLGVEPAVLSRASFFDFLAPGDSDLARQRIEGALRGQTEQFDFAFRRPDGSEVTVAAGLSPFRDDGGRITGALGMFADITERRRAEVALERANERFALAADAVQELVYDWDLGTGLVYRNPGLLHITGFLPDEVPPQATWWASRIHPDDRALGVYPPDLDPTASGRFSHEYRVLHRDGRYRTVWDVGRVVRDARGNATRVVGATVDITEREAVERTLEVLARAAETMPAGLDYAATLQRVAEVGVPALADWCAVDLLDADGAVQRVAVAATDGRSLEWRPNAKTIRSAPRGFDASPNVPGASPLPGPDQVALRADGVSAAIVVPIEARGERIGAMTLAAFRPSHTWSERDVALAVEVARRGGLAIENARLFRDAQAAEARYRGLFEGSKDGIVLFDQEGWILAANPAFHAMTGFDLPRLLGMRSVDLFAGDQAAAEEQFASLRAAGEWRGEFDLRRADGSALPVEAWVTAIELPTGRTFVASMRDVSERRAFERTQEEFLSTVAHDLKNPLAAVRGQAQLLRRRLRKGDALDAEKLLAGIEGIDAGAQRMGSMIDDLVDVFRLRGGQPLDLRRQPVDLVDLVRRIVEEADRVDERHRLRTVTDEESLVGLWDAARLDRVLANLLGNAIKYSPNGGDITVTVRRETVDGAPWAVVAVEDQGMGIPPADLPFIFERFRRAGNAGGFGGAGIGLSGVRLIVEGHGGTVTAESVEGQGSVFTVRLPIDES